MRPAWLVKLQEAVAALVARATQRIDQHAKRDSESWGASMEYKRRYTNPDDAKRNRAPPPPKS